MILSPDTTILIQGMTGKEGQRGLAYMQAAGARVVAGVTPGKGGESIDGVPVFNSVAEALEAFPAINATSIYVPSKFVLSAAQEALDAGIPLVHIFAENVPVLDATRIYAHAQEKGARVVGPSAVGVVMPGISKIGSIGGEKLDTFLPVGEKSGIALISKSGGMSAEIANLFTQANIPQRLVAGIGGDRIIGSTYADFLSELLEDPQTDAIVIIGEIGGNYEEMIAEAYAATNKSKPLYAFISGMFAETLPQGVSFGHAGAIVSKTEGTRQGKIDAIEAAGGTVAQSPEQIITLVAEGRNGQ